jgi:hypothetical protein
LTKKEKGKEGKKYSEINYKYPNKINTTSNMKRQRLNYSKKSVSRVLIYFVKTS